LYDVISALLELQEIDLKTYEQRKLLEEIPANLAAMRQEVARLAEFLERNRQQLTDTEQLRQEQEREIARQTELAGKSKIKLSAARNERESKAAQREIETLRKAVQDREEEVIELIRAIEQKHAAIEEQTRQLGELEQEVREAEADAARRQVEVDAAVQAATEARRSVTARLPADTLRLYERIQKRLGRAVVEVADGKCTACNMGILPQVYTELYRGGDKIHTCSSCFRIIVHRPHETVSSETAEA